MNTHTEKTYNLTNGKTSCQVHLYAEGIFALMGADSFWDGIENVLVLSHADDEELERGTAAILIHGESPRSPLAEIQFGIGVTYGDKVGVSSILAEAPLMSAIEVAAQALNDAPSLVADLDTEDDDNDNHDDDTVVYH